MEATGGTVHSQGGNGDLRTVIVGNVRRARAMLNEWLGSTRGETHPCEYDVELVRITQSLLHNSVAQATHRAYVTGQRCYIAFCRRYGLTVVPGPEATLTFVIAHLRRAGLAAAST